LCYAAVAAADWVPRVQKIITSESVSCEREIFSAATTTGVAESLLSVWYELCWFSRFILLAVLANMQIYLLLYVQYKTLDINVEKRFYVFV